MAMSCKNPMLAVRVGDQYKFVGAVNESPVARGFLHSTDGRYIVLPCGQCYACRINKSAEWAARCVMEAKSHEENCFITLTYNECNLPADGSLVKEDFTKFIKRLRKNTGERIRYYACGEYGDQFGRPHFHACLFGFKPKDLVLWKVRNGISLYRSLTIEKAWQFRGFITVGDVTYDSAAYVARYVLKKMTGDLGKELYGDKIPPYTTMSRKPGIAADFFDEYHEQIYPNDFIVIRDKLKLKPPRYFDYLYDIKNGEGSFVENIKPSRELKSFKDFTRHMKEYTLKRVMDSAHAKEVKGLKRYRRDYVEIVDDDIEV